ncbi:hypothetical protein FRUB_08420 [Fimbriiglobus ruber]|uniref:Uncharacterized protein n=1 Tax=Fimbriiglobus ruber TaxID=1908690 RepID=A0A225DIB8_9BACT|nr:hypothetical protein FRUB_08420 [Fimbriiglobus ruber]
MSIQVRLVLETRDFSAKSAKNPTGRHLECGALPPLLFF